MSDNLKLVDSETIQKIKEKTNMVELIGETVALKSAGSGSYKGLCPFHSENSPSFHVTPSKGFWHCFGCQEGGDIFDYLQKRDGLTFPESIELLAERASIPIQINYSNENFSGTSRRRLTAINAEASKFFQTKWYELPETHVGKQFLREKLFDEPLCEKFNVGWAPENEWDSLIIFLKKHKYTEKEIIDAGLAVENGKGGIYDRFRGRVMWPIKNLTGQNVGFGGRKVLASDNGPKYLNTPETSIYKKNELLYNLDEARKNTKEEGLIVVVEGYTDVMALSATGIKTAVASCGTAFGVEHATVLKRVLGDGVGLGGITEIVFMFDGDSAGQKAALRASSISEVFIVPTSAAVDIEGRDPCDVRILSGDASLRKLLDDRSPLVKFAIKSILSKHDIRTPEGRVLALNEINPVISSIKNPIVREEYRNEIAGELGLTADKIKMTAPQQKKDQTIHNEGEYNLEREALLLVLQYPWMLQDWYSSVEDTAFMSKDFKHLHNIILKSFDILIPQNKQELTEWYDLLISTVEIEAPELKKSIAELSISPAKIPIEEIEIEEDQKNYPIEVIRKLLDTDAKRLLEALKIEQKQAETDEENYFAITLTIMELEKYRKTLKNNFSV